MLPSPFHPFPANATIPLLPGLSLSFIVTLHVSFACPFVRKLFPPYIQNFFRFPLVFAHFSCAVRFFFFFFPFFISGDLYSPLHFVCRPLHFS